MNTKIQSIHFDADKKLLAFIENRINKLELFSDEILGAEVYLRLEKDSERENKVVEIKLEIPGNDMFAKKNSKSFEEATDLTVEALKKQLGKTRKKKKVT
ncbi:MAG: ribosome hibernation-promoting factor, HPF/YfiA family [Bacteroidota bacterium]